MQTRIVAIMMICFVALSGATAVSSGVSYTSLDSMNENNVTEVSVNATPAVSNSKQRRQYRLSYVSWKNRIADLRMSAIFKWLRTEYYPSLVSIADAASSGSSGVSFARDSMTIQDAWWDLDETMDMELHRDSNDLSGNYDEVGCGCGFIYDQFKDFNVADLRYCICCGSEFVLPVKKKKVWVFSDGHGYLVDADVRDSKQLLKDMPRLPVLSRIEILELAREIHMVDGNGIAYENNGTYFNVRLPINRFNFFKQLDIISDWACGEYGYENGDVNTEINSWKMPSFEDNGIDDRERRGTILVTISRRGLEVATALHQMKVAQEVLDGARDSKTWNFSIEIHSPSGGGSDVRGNVLWGYDFLLNCIINAFDYFDMLIRVTYEDEKHGDVVVLDQISDGARDSKEMKYTHYVQNESHLGIDKIEGNTKDELIASLFAHIAATSGYHEISKKDAVKSIIEDGLASYQIPDCLMIHLCEEISHTIDLTPSPKGYARMLEVVIKDSPNAADVEWATAELNKMKKQKRMSQFNRDGSMDLTVSCNCGCGYTTRLEGQFPMALGVESYYCSWIPVDAYGEAVRDSAWDDEKLSYAIELLSEKDLIKYQEWVDSQEGYWNGDGTISFANANAKLDYDMRELRHEKLQSDMGYCRETELLLCNLERHGFTLVGHRPYGDDLIKFNRTRDDEGNMPSNHYDIQNIIYDCWNNEETTLIVNHPSRGDREIGIRLVYGNEFGVLACDYSAPKEYGSRPEWYVALKSACNTDIDSIEEYEAITGSSMEYSVTEWGNISGKITFSAMNELGYRYKLCPECLKSGHENNQSYCFRYGASLSDADTGCCIGYPSEEIARDSIDVEKLTHASVCLDIALSEAEQDADSNRAYEYIAATLKDIKSIMDARDSAENLEYEDAKRIVEEAGIIDDNDGWLDVDYRKIAHLLAEVKQLHWQHENAMKQLQTTRKWIRKQQQVLNEIACQADFSICPRIVWLDEARDSAEMAALVPSRYDENVSARELHPNVSLLNPDGFKWSDEQLHILNDFASWFQEYEDGTKPTSPRMVIESVAGSGKTTLVKELLSIINRFNSATKTIASAFNVHIAKILKGEIKDQQKNGFRGLEILGTGNNAKNTVSAGGYDIIRSHLKAQGITNVGMESKVEGKYLVLSKIVLSEYLAMISKPDGVKNANIGEVNRILKEVCDFSQAAKPNYRNQYMKLARDLKKFVEALMGQGFVPTRSKSKDLKEIRRIYGQIALVQGLNDTVLLKLPKNAMFTLARDVLLRSMDTWNSEKEVFPFAWTKNYSFSDVIVARTEGFAESGNFERARFDSNNLYPLWKTLTRDVWDDNKLKTNMLFDHLSKAGLIWPPRGKESGKPTVSAAPSGKPACEVWVKGNQMSVSFRDGLAASSKIDGSRACDFLKYNGIRSQWPRNNLNAGKYNESIVKKLETKFKSAKGGFKLHGDSSADIVIEESRSKVTVSFSDHTWLPIALNLEPSADVKKDMAFIDEIQDLSVAKGSLIRKLIRNDGDSGLVLVGDSRQSIMQFAGADAASMTDNAVASNCVSYPMTICWRGSHEVAHSANRVMSNVLEEVQGLWPQTEFPDYLSHKSPSIETWPVGKPMENVGTDKLVPMVKELQEENPDVEIAVLSRVNQPLGAVILDLVTNGISITTPSGEGGIVKSIKPILTNKYVEPKSPSQGIGIDMDNTNFKDLRSVRNRLEQVVSWAFNQSMIRNKGDADAAAKDEKFVTIEGNAELAEALIELWFREGVPSSTKHKDFVDWFNNVLLSSSGNPVHVSSVHRFKGGECDYAFILRSAKGKPDKETGECMPREIFMNKSMFDAPENAIAEACIMYVAMTRAKVQNVQLWFEKSGEEEVVIDPTRCVECNALTDPDDHAVCIECNGLLCNEYRPLRGPQGGLLHKGGEFDTTLSCGEFLPRSADDFFDFTSTERLERNKHERYCDSCFDNAPRDSNDIRHELEQAGFLPANGATRVCCNCEKQAVFDVDTAIGTRSFCSEKCYAEYNGLEVMDDPNFYGMMLITRKPIETVYEVHLWTREIEGKKLGEFDEFFKFKDEESARKLYNQITDYTYKILMQYDGDDGDVLLEYDNHDPHENMGHRDSTRGDPLGNDGDESLELDNYDPYENMVCNSCETLIDLGMDMLPIGICIDCYIITRKPIDENMGHRDSTNAYIDECPECAENTCLNNVSTNPKYHDIECYSCGYYSIQKTILISTPPYRQTKQIDGYMSEQEIEEMRANHARDSVDFCNTCDAHIDLQGRDMLPRGMCIDCFIAQRKEEMGIPNPIITDNWPENDPDEEPRDSSEFVSITLEEMDNFLVDAQGFRRLNPDEVGHYSREWVYEYYLDMKPDRRIRKYKDCRIRIYSSIPVSYKWHEINESTDVESLSDPINADKTFINPKYPDWVRIFDTTKSRGKGKDAIRCILLSGKADGSFSYAYHSKAGRCYRKATPTKRITNWRLNLLKKYEQWIWEEKI